MVKLEVPKYIVKLASYFVLKVNPPAAFTRGEADGVFGVTYLAFSPYKQQRSLS